MILVCSHLEFAKTHSLDWLRAAGPPLLVSVFVHVLWIIWRLDCDLHRVLSNFSTNHSNLSCADLFLDRGGSFRGAIAFVKVNVAERRESTAAQDREEQSEHRNAHRCEIFHCPASKPRESDGDYH